MIYRLYLLKNDLVIPMRFAIEYTINNNSYTTYNENYK